MNQFTDLLRNLNSKIDLPQPAKSRIILEIAADLNDTYHLYQKRGLSKTEAANKAREKFELSDEIISDLSSIHTNLFRQWLDRTIGKSQALWEKVLFITIFLFLLISTVYIVTKNPFFAEASLFVYPILAALIMATILWSVKFYQLYIKKDHRLKRLRYGLSWFKILGLINLFTGISGYFLELYLSKAEVLFLGPLFIILIQDTNEELLSIIELLSKNASLILICMLVIMITAILWLIIVEKINSIEQAEAAMLLNE